MNVDGLLPVAAVVLSVAVLIMSPRRRDRQALFVASILAVTDAAVIKTHPTFLHQPAVATVARPQLTEPPRAVIELAKEIYHEYANTRHEL